MSSSEKVVPAREAEVRERIFASALHRFSQKGFAATSLREIAEEARTTKPMIYYYFGSKEGLYGGMVHQVLQAMAREIGKEFPSELAPPERAIVYSERYLDHFLDQEEIIGLVLREVFGLGGFPMETFARTLAEEVVCPLEEVLARGMADGSLQQDDPPVCASAVTGILNMFILAHVFGGAPIDREAALRQVRHYVDGLRQRA